MALAPSLTGVVQLSQFGLSWLRPRDCSETVEIPPLFTWLRQNPCLVSAWVRAGRWASYYFTNLWIRKRSFGAFNFSLISFSSFKKLWSITAFILYLRGRKKRDKKQIYVNQKRLNQNFTVNSEASEDWYSEVETRPQLCSCCCMHYWNVFLHHSFVQLSALSLPLDLQL